jgi:hypothetical protein
MALTVAGTRAPLSYCASLRAAKIEAAISSTRLRPSSTVAVYQIRRLFATTFQETAGGLREIAGAVAGLAQEPPVLGSFLCNLRGSCAGSNLV